MSGGHKVFGIGLNKTGTKTLGEALTHLGYRHQTFDGRLMRAFARGDLAPILDTARAYDSFEDWPWPLVYPTLARRFPDARFVLTLRASPETWYASLCRHADRHGPSPWRKIAYGYADPATDQAHHLALYRRHAERVRRFFAAEPWRLMAVCWERGDGWPELCDFLGVETPALAFPERNVDGSDAWKFMPPAPTG